VVTVVPPDADLTALPVASAVWEPAPDLPTSAECWLMAGGPHHTVLSTALAVPVVEQFAELTRTELVLIDEASSPGSIRKELRWNAAYQLLAGGLR
jgi:L-arabinose isomerase